MRRYTHSGFSRRFVTGFTLMELMVAISIVGILVAIAIPNLRSFLQNGKISGASNDLLRSVQLARTEAIKRQTTVVVCASTNPMAATPTCSYGSFSGWIVFLDTNGNWQSDGGAETVLERHDLLDSSVFLRQDGNGIESFSQTGFANPAGVKVPTRNVVVCDVRGIQQVGNIAVGRAVLIAPTGRARVAQTFSDVTNALAATGLTCP